MAEKAQPQELSEILKIRRDKLENMQKQGSDPYPVSYTHLRAHET